MDIQYTIASSDDHLQQILELQRINLPDSLGAEEKKSQGFVTVEHNFDLLKQMNAQYPHAVALSDNRVVGYALVMLPSFRNEIDILISMFDQIESSIHTNSQLQKYFVMGQVCVAKEFRGQGLFYGLYNQLKATMSADFDCCITEIDPLNLRSTKAHQNQGFKLLKRYNDSKERSWDLIYWAWD